MAGLSSMALKITSPGRFGNFVWLSGPCLSVKTMRQKTLNTVFVVYAKVERDLPIGDPISYLFPSTLAVLKLSKPLKPNRQTNIHQINMMVS